MKAILQTILQACFSLFLALILGGGLILAVGENPLQVYGILLKGALGSKDGIGYSLFYATPLIFTGLAVAFGFRGGLFNIGGEGQLYVGAFAAAWIGLTFPTLPSFLLLPLSILSAFLAGAIWGAIPGILKARLGVHEVINTIMMNFLASGLVNYLVTYPYRAPGDMIPQTVEIPTSSRIPRMSFLLAPLGIDFPERVPFNAAFILALFVSFLIYLFLWKTRWGYEVRAVGLNPLASRYAGINVTWVTIITMTVSGGLAGLVGVHEVLGYRYRYYDHFSPGYGFLGIAVALLGRNHPLGVCLSALLFGVLMRGGLYLDVVTEHISKDIVEILQALLILVVASEKLFAKR
ncbi:MAG: ABC transporter permease [Candidatus Tectomicrobia bacterium]|nr:ABC transporter permease [Candidatus Tectomicrobia bacterium]